MGKTLKEILCGGLILLVIAIVARTAPAPYPLRVDSERATLPQIENYRGGQRTFRVSFFDGTNPTILAASDFPFLSWATNSLAGAQTTATWSKVTGRTGQVDMTWTSADLNHTPGRYQYEVGIVSNNIPSVYRHGTMLLRGSPFAAGAAAISWTTNFYPATFNIIGTFPAGTMDEADPIYAAASNSFLNLKGGVMAGDILMGTNDIFDVVRLEIDGAVSDWTFATQSGELELKSEGGDSFDVHSHYKFMNTNMVLWFDGVLNGTNGIFYGTDGTNFWLLEK